MRIARTVFAASLWLGTATGTAQAAELCFILNNFTDVFRLNFIDFGGHTLVVGQDFAIVGPRGYSIPLVGATAPAPPPNTNPAVKIVGLQGANRSTFFGNHADCTMDFLIGTPAPPILSLSCTGRARGIFTRFNVAATVINCALAAQALQAAPAAAKAKAWGEGLNQ